MQSTGSERVREWREVKSSYGRVDPMGEAQAVHWERWPHCRAAVPCPLRSLSELMKSVIAAHGNRRSGQCTAGGGLGTASQPIT